jgi:hypothetical protein
LNRYFITCKLLLIIEQLYKPIILYYPMENFHWKCTENVLKIHWKWVTENIRKLPVKNWFSVSECMVNVLKYTENVLKMYRKQPEFPENILNLVQNSHWNYTEIILKLYWKICMGIILKLYQNMYGIIQKYIRNYKEIIQNTSGMQFMWLFVKFTHVTQN